MSPLRDRSGTSRDHPWTLKEVIQGKPLGHPSHAMFVHFPVAFSIGALGLDLLSRIGAFPAAPLAGTWLLIAALAGWVAAGVTGYLDRWDMVCGSTKRRRATAHMLVQIGAMAIFALALVVRWGERHDPEASWAWIAIEVVGVLVLVVGQWLGGSLVYQMGVRVSTGAGGRAPER